MKEKPKLYVIKKYIKATSIRQVLRKDKTTDPHDIWVDETWKEKNLADAIGFQETTQEPDDE